MYSVRVSFKNVSTPTVITCTDEQDRTQIFSLLTSAMHPDTNPFVTIGGSKGKVFIDAREIRMVEMLN